MSKSNIEWTGFTWNPIVGCSVVSPGCKRCYAMKMARRIELMGTAAHYAGLTMGTKAGAVWTGKLARAPEETLFEPLRRKKPTTWFVNSMSDLFHEAVPDDWIDRIFAVMALCPQHTFQVLTKRSKRMREYMKDFDSRRADSLGQKVIALGYDGPLESLRWPPPNVWMGISCEDQQRADERIPDLLATPAAVRFISAEPLLAPVDLTRIPIAHGFVEIHGGQLPALSWVIVGGESGPRARDFRLSWAKSLIEQCQAAGVPAFMKQVGSNAWDDISYQGSVPAFKTRDRKGGSPEEWPSVLQIRQMPA
jgi:protein gp37